ncbi:MAG: hypothetical protein OEZ43_07530 [Gammaproteobacteria bacterium]|nr:hypothetical protein [Gammaproteobacteria bacterium]
MLKYILMLTLASLTVGCAITPGVDLVREKNIAIQTDDSAKGELRNIKIEKYDDKILITGLVSRDTQIRLLKGHVHIDVFDKSNVIQKSVESDYRFRRTVARTAKTARFAASLDIEPGPNSRVVVSHHDSKTATEPGRAQPELPPVLDNVNEGGGLFIIE